MRLKDRAALTIWPSISTLEDAALYSSGLCLRRSPSAACLAIIHVDIVSGLSMSPAMSTGTVGLATAVTMFLIRLMMGESIISGLRPFESENPARIGFSTKPSTPESDWMSAWTRACSAKSPA
eukprot:COSAG04_NODE_2506_length_3995_cov_1.565708_4_plen_123_part_00